MSLDDKRKAIVDWYRTEFAGRSVEASFERGPIEWRDKATRLSWEEIQAKAAELGLDTSVVSLEWFVNQGSGSGPGFRRMKTALGETAETLRQKVLAEQEAALQGVRRKK